MARHRSGTTVAITLAFLLPGLGLGSAALAGTAGRAIGSGSSQAGGSAEAGGGCLAGAHTLSRFGDHVYPDTGNGGYTSLHTSVDLVYDATTNQFLPGNHVVLTDRAAQCLTSFSLDFERKSTANVSIGPDMTVNSVTVNGAPATFAFVQPTYPGDPHGQNDPNPLAHEASEHTPVGGPGHNQLPPACSPELKSTSFATRNSQNGQQCPANKLVITPSAPIASGSVFAVTVNYTGRPGVHTDGDGTTAGWFRSNQPRGAGGFVTTAPVGTEFGFIVRPIETGCNAAIAPVVTNCTATAAQISAGSPTAMRRAALVKNIGPSVVFIGTSGVTASTGFQVDVGESFTLPLGALVPLYGICAATLTSTMHVLELS